MKTDFNNGDELYAEDLNDNFSEADSRLISAESRLTTAEGDITSLQAVTGYVPTGAIFWFSTTSAPTGYLECDGAAVSRSTYADLFGLLVTSQAFSSQVFTCTTASPSIFTKSSHGFTGGERLRLSTTGTLPTGLNNTGDYYVERIGVDTFYLLASPFGSRVNVTGAGSGTHSYTRSLWGLGNGSTTFNVPDLRGEFVRGWDDGRSVDASRSFGSGQNDAFRSHSHSFTIYGGENSGSIVPATTRTEGTFPTTSGTAATGGAETRPRNVALLACIKT